MKTNSFLLAIGLFLLSFISAYAQNFESEDIPKFDFYTRGGYRTEVPRPQSIWRFDVGDNIQLTHKWNRLVIILVHLEAAELRR